MATRGASGRRWRSRWSRRGGGGQPGPGARRAITDAQLEHIYKTGSWDTCQCDALPEGVDYVVFNQAVNAGLGQSAKWLQAAVGVAVDGGMGPQTIAVALQRAPGPVINAMCDARAGIFAASSPWRLVADVRARLASPGRGCAGAWPAAGYRCCGTGSARASSGGHRYSAVRGVRHRVSWVTWRLGREAARSAGDHRRRHLWPRHRSGFTGLSTRRGVN